MKVYTKSGDAGTTSLVGGKRIAKHHPRIEAYGTIDELSAHVALLHDLLEERLANPKREEEAVALSPMVATLELVQDHLMRIGSHLASERGDEKYLPRFDATMTQLLEEQIDQMQANLPALKHFTLPGGSLIVSQSHVARSVCRRAERRITELAEAEPLHNEEVSIYTNRLSDYLYVLGRSCVQLLKINEKIWAYED